ncbi:MAG TPA: hypothetical protein VHK90_04800 [Thermoanaerobaculia bacterium]|nr:hypothetical protein [Thermoanaerobaculia bacterium]
MRTTAVILVMFLSFAAQAQAPKSFAEGVLAFENKEWAKAEKLMRETIAGNPNESAGTVSIRGQWFETYVPHYFLARALAKQGKCEEALRHFAESERQGVTPTISDFKRHLDTRGGCRPQGKKEAPAKKTLEVTVPFGEEEVVTPAPTTAAPAKPERVPEHVREKERDPEIDAARLRLVAAVSAYLGGRYEETVRLLDRPFSDAGAAAEAALLRAAARHALYRIGGAANETLEKQIASDITLYRKVRPNGRPDPRVFSPGFIALVK